MIDLLNINEAAKWASNYIGRPVTSSNISYLVQYTKINKYKEENIVKIDIEELKKYYDENIIKKQEEWKKSLGDDLDWSLSFAHLREVDTTKHVHRLHPYKGKFIPQLVEYFLDDHINTHKKVIYFKKGETILDPFMGSGTTIIQAAELELNSIGIDISEFNCLISKVKIENYNSDEVNTILKKSLEKTKDFSHNNFDDNFDTKLKEKLYTFNKKYFPFPEYKQKVSKGEIKEKKYGDEKIKEFFYINKEFFEKNGTKIDSNLWDEKEMNNFLAKWFTKRIRQELLFYIKLFENIKDEKIKNLMRVVISRTARSCRATTHSDLATLVEPQYKPYYCSKHKKICTPVNTILKHLEKSTIDTIKRIEEFSKLKKDVKSFIIHGDSRTIDILKEINDKGIKKIDGIFTSPPYVGQIDYHEQHAYAYELFNISRKDDKEIGPLYKGQGQKAKDEYVEGISKVLKNINKYVKEDGNYFIVANDKHNLYPKIAELSGLKIVDKFKRPVLNRTEKDRRPYAEVIFHMKKNV